MFPTLVPILLGLLLAGSLVQLIWTRHILRRARLWMDQLELQEMSRAGKICRIAGCTWLAGIIPLVIVIFVVPDDLTFKQVTQWQRIVGGASLWSLIMGLICYWCSQACAAIEKSNSSRRSPKATPSFVQALATGELGPMNNDAVELAIERQWTTIKVTTSLCWTALIIVAIAAPIIDLRYPSYDPGIRPEGAFLFVGLLLLVSPIVVPGLIILMITRWAVGFRARRTQLLWFLALTAQQRRSFAVELQGWANAQPGALGRRLRGAARDLIDGDSLGNALAGRKLLTPSDLISLRVAERTGDVAETLRELAANQSASMQNDVLNAMNSGPLLYLATLLLVAINVVGFVMYFIIPKFKAIFVGFGVELPNETMRLIYAADVLVNYFYVVFPIGMLSVLSLLATCVEAFFRGWSETRFAWAVGWGTRAEVPRLLRRLKQAVVAQLP